VELNLLGLFNKNTKGIGQTQKKAYSYKRQAQISKAPQICFLEATKKWFKLRSALPSFFHFLLFHSFVIKTTIKFTFAFATQLGFESKRPRRLSTNVCVLIKSSGKA